MRTFFLAALIMALPFSAGAQVGGVTPYGDPGCGDGFVPTFHTSGENFVFGNAKFALALENLTGGSPGLVWLSGKAASISLFGQMIHVDPTGGLGLPFLATGTSGIAGTGLAGVPLPLPGDPQLAGLKVFLQGFSFSTVQPGALVTTQGLALTVMNSSSVAATVVHDRLKYQAYFAGTTPAQAALLGQGIWATRSVSGFQYIRTELFSCGGQSHWIVIAKHILTGMEFCLIPGGTFRMGDINGTGWINEVPVRHVRVAPFLIGRTEVTQSQYFAITNQNPWRVASPYVKEGPDYPACYVQWTHCVDYCTKAGLRLPTEAEWEYACRAGVQTCFFFGENFPPSNLGLYAWYLSSVQPNWHARQVGQLLPNAFGLYDMIGNVTEWCQDAWHDGFRCAPVDGRAWEGSPTSRVHRGGNWMCDDWNSRTAIRGADSTGWFFRVHYIGFRPVVSW